MAACLVCATGNVAAAQALPASCASVPVRLGGDTNAVLQALTAYYDTNRDLAIKGASPDWGNQRQTLVNCVLDIAFRDFAAESQGGGRLAYQPRTIALLRFLDYIKGGWTAAGAAAAKLIEFGKQARRANAADKELVLTIDRAISNGPGGLKQIVVRDPNLDYEGNVRKRIDALTQVETRGDYAGGPLQMLVNDLLAVAYEESAMIAAMRRDDAGALARIDDAVAQLDAALATTRRADIVSRPDVDLFDNDFRFRKALLQRLAGAGDWQAPLIEIVRSSPTWDESRDLDHVYVRSFLRLPPEDLYVSGKAPGAVGKVAPVNTFFNPGQIAAYLCSWDEPAGDIWTKAQALDGYMNGFVNHDYRVVLRSSRDAGKRTRDLLEKLSRELGAALGDKWEALESALESSSPGAVKGTSFWRSAIQRGAKRCGMDGEIAAVYKDFARGIQANWDAPKARDNVSQGIFVGGFLSRSEAEKVAGDLQRLLRLKDEPYIARPKING